MPTMRTGRTPRRRRRRPRHLPKHRRGSALQRPRSTRRCWSPLARGRLTRDWDDATTTRADSDTFGSTLYRQAEDSDRAIAAAVAKIAEGRVACADRSCLGAATAGGDRTHHWRHQNPSPRRRDRFAEHHAHRRRARQAQRSLRSAAARGIRVGHYAAVAARSAAHQCRRLSAQRSTSRPRHERRNGRSGIGSTITPRGGCDASPEPSWGTVQPLSNRRLSARIWLVPTDRRSTTAQSPSCTSQLRAR
jgi:hypothetical protein